MQQMLHIRLFGSFAFSVGETILSTDMPQRVQELLAYLLIHRSRSQLRSQIASLFWPDSSEEQARTNLRNTLYVVRRMLPVIDSCLVSGYQALSWQPNQFIDLDVDRFEQHILHAKPHAGGDPQREQAELREAVQCYTNDLLNELYADWVQPERDRLRFLFHSTLDRLVSLLAGQEDYPSAIFFARKRIQYDALDEDAYRQVMLLEAQAGNLAGVRQIYQQCQEKLNRELSASPGPQTSQLYDSLLSGRPPGSSQRLLLPLTGGGPVKTNTVPPRPPGLVGREADWAWLQEQVRALQDSQARLALFCGEIGIGKTRMLAEAGSGCRELGLMTAAARCYSGEGDLAMSPVREWLRQLVPQPLEPVWMNEVARLLPECTPARASEAPPLPAQNGLDRARFFEALARFLLQALGPEARRPLVLLIDDLQWCDRDTLEWIHFVLRFAPRAPLLVIGSLRRGSELRSPALKSLLLSLQSASRLQLRVLSALSRPETAHLAGQLTGLRIDAAQAERLYAETEGVPLLVDELASADWLHSPGAPFHPPVFTAGVLEEAARLSAAALSLAQTAAVAGRPVTYDFLLRAAELNEESLVSALEELLAVHFLREDGDSYVFAHAKIPQVLCSQLSTLVVRRISLRLAQVNSITLPQKF